MLCNEILNGLLLESDRQTDMERLARMFLDHYIYRCMLYLPDKLDRIKNDPYGLYDFPGAILGDVFPNRRGLSKFDKDIQRFVKERGNLRLDVTYQDGTTLATYASKVPQPEIILNINKYDYANFRNSLQDRILEWPLRNLLNTRRHSLVHELQHAFDDWASGGKYKHNARSREAFQSKLDKNADPEAKFKLYLNNPIEISARYRHTVSELGNKVVKSWKDYFSEFKYTFDGWKILPDEDKLRLTQRLAAYWIGQQRPREQDFSADVKALQEKLRAKYGGYIYVHYGKVRNAITIDSFGTDDAQIKRDILQAVIRFADVRRAVVSTSDLPYGRDFKDMGFVNQRSRNHDFALPVGTTMYRPARQSMQKAA